MISPYQAQGPQGNLLGSIMDFIGQRTAQQLERGTRQQLNGQLGYGENVDPFSMQKFQGEGQRQNILGQENMRANENQGWMRGDRAAIGQMAGALGGIDAVSGNPLYAAIQQGATNPAVAQALLGQLFGDKSQQTAYDNAMGLGAQNNAYNGANDAAQHQYRMDEIGASNSGQTRAGSILEQTQKTVQDAFAHKAATDSPEWPGGDRLKIQQAELMGLLPNGRPAEVVLAEMAADAEYNKPGGRRDKAKKAADDRASGRFTPGNESGDMANEFSPEQNQELSQLRLNNAFNPKDFSPAQIVEEIVRQTKGTGQGYHTKNAQMVYPELYEKALTAYEQQQKVKNYQDELNKTKDPVMFYINKFLETTLPQ